MVSHGPISSSPTRGAPRGFTLVELLVVMAIIGVLIALLVPVLGVARRSVQKSSIVTEVRGMGQAMQAFKTQYQTDFPPDFTTVGARGGVTLDQQALDQFISRIFRYRNPATDVPRQPPAYNTPIINGFANLDPGEALVLWLRGFSNDPANPLFGPPGVNPDQVERTPIFNFDRDRLKDLDADGFYEYYPAYASQQPYVYLVHYNYVTAFALRDENLHYLYNATSRNASRLCPRPYLSRRDISVTVLDPRVKTNFAAPDSFQIISAGLDGEFGIQVNSETPQDYLPFAYPIGPYPDKQHLDNVVSFGKGALEDDLP